MSTANFPKFRNLDELREYLTRLEGRVVNLESENKHLKNALSRVNQSQAKTFKTKADRLPNTAIISASFFARAFAVWGHYFVAQLIISIPVFICYLILMFTVLSGAQTP
ncbi:MAG: hypothetical protein U9Q82_07470 [Chloroflexota bacterium]|nr:hypothetical protein [Chloroflexota bacterium]